MAIPACIKKDLFFRCYILQVWHNEPMNWVTEQYCSDRLFEVSLLIIELSHQVFALEIHQNYTNRDKASP